MQFCSGIPFLESNSIATLSKPEMNVMNSTVYINMIMSFIQIVVAYSPLRNKTRRARNYYAVCLCPVCLSFEPAYRTSGDL